MAPRTRITQATAALIGAALIGLLLAGPAGANLPGCRDCIVASDIARNAVKAAELANDLKNSIDANDIATGGVGSAEIKNGSVGIVDLAFNPATQSELDLVQLNTPLANGRVNADGTSELSGWLPPLGTDYDAVENRYVFDYSLLAGEGLLDFFAAVVTPGAELITAFWETDDTAGELHVYLRDDTNAPVEEAFGIAVLL